AYEISVDDHPQRALRSTDLICFGEDNLDAVCGMSRVHSSETLNVASPGRIHYRSDIHGLQFQRQLDPHKSAILRDRCEYLDALGVDVFGVQEIPVKGDEQTFVECDAGVGHSAVFPVDPADVRQTGVAASGNLELQNALVGCIGDEIGLSADITRHESRLNLVDAESVRARIAGVALCSLRSAAVTETLDGFGHRGGARQNAAPREVVKPRLVVAEIGCRVRRRVGREKGRSGNVGEDRSQHDAIALIAIDALGLLKQGATFGLADVDNGNAATVLGIWIAG